MCSSLLHLTTSIFLSVCLTFALCLVLCCASTVLCVALTCERNTGEAPHRVPVFHDSILLMHFPANWRLHKALLAEKVTVIRRVFWLGIYITLYGPYTSSFILPAKIATEWMHNDVYDAFFIKYLYHWPSLQFHPSLACPSLMMDALSIINNYA